MTCPIHGNQWCSCRPAPTTDSFSRLPIDDIWHTKDCSVHSPTLRPCSCGLETRLRQQLTAANVANESLEKELEQRYADLSVAHARIAELIADRDALLWRALEWAENLSNCGPVTVQTIARHIREASGDDHKN